MKAIGFIGSGKMAQAMIGGMLEQGNVKRDHMIVSARTDKTLTSVQERFGIVTTKDNREVVEKADFVFVAVHPGEYYEVLAEVADLITSSKLVISIAAGVAIADVEAPLSGEVKVVRTMPNTPALVGEGMTAVCTNEYVTEEELQAVTALLTSFGKVEVLPESAMDAIPAISGSSPAFVYMFIEAMADGGVKQGLSRDQAYRLASQAVLGAAKMVRDSGKHPGELKDQVCSPGGATIAGVATLEQEGLRGTVISAMDSCTNKVKDLL